MTRPPFNDLVGDAPPGEDWCEDDVRSRLRDETLKWPLDRWVELRRAEQRHGWAQVKAALARLDSRQDVEDALLDEALGLTKSVTLKRFPLQIEDDSEAI